MNKNCNILEELMIKGKKTFLYPEDNCCQVKLVPQKARPTHVKLKYVLLNTTL